MPIYNPHFAVSWTFPDAKGLLKRKYKSLEEIVNSCFVSVDTNILLAPYRLGGASLDALRNIYKALSKDRRLIIPAHVIREFEKHRIKERTNVIQTLLNQRSSSKAPVEKEIEFLKTDPLYKRILETNIEAKKHINKIQTEIDDLIEEMKAAPEKHDPILDMYRDIFPPHIRDLTLNSEEQKEFSEELKFRIKMKIPPAFKDEEKLDEGAGDLIIWKTALQEAKKTKKDMLFVTQEEKSDWFIKGAGLLQTRPELSDEYYRASDGGTLHIVPLATFARIFNAEKAIVEEAQSISAATEDDLQFEEVLNNGLSQLEETRKRISLIKEALGKYGSFDGNDSLSLPWNRSNHNLRHELHMLMDRIDKMEKDRRK